MEPRSTVEWEIATLIPGTGPILRVLNNLRNKGTVFVLQTARLSPGLDDHRRRMMFRSPVRASKNSVLKKYFRAKYTLK